MVEDLIFIPGNVPSLKNAKVKTARGIFSSKTVKKYLSIMGIQHYSSSRKEVTGYKRKPNEFELLKSRFEEQLRDKGKPVLLSFHFVRDTKRLFDFGNATELIFDLLTAHNIIDDDNISIVIPSVMSIDGVLPTKENIRDIQWYSVDKTPGKAGVYLKFH